MEIEQQINALYELEALEQDFAEAEEEGLSADMSTYDGKARQLRFYFEVPSGLTVASRRFQVS